ncbi:MULTISPECIES: radical SAM protein [unclassified Thalassolituus]|uniref:radical SAM protein n=1 Tax=Oceanospirillaceae TaxID=135620 RepID=UPI001197B7A7|nr:MULTISPECIES: radical SAM protein [unclassified Thalassolituus]MCA6060997.1 radical SAM protein [Thalassolituus sp. ST750PaO-4]TVV43811.1 radical SAM protein [Thalassolituus sp. C2-1]
MFNYIEPVFRPPSEARSLILQVTNGCSWNQCTFCDMYTQPQKKFRARDEADVLNEIRQAAALGPRFEKVFLADGDAMVLPVRRLTNILLAIKEHLPWVRRVGAYCLPRNIRKKSAEEMTELRRLGLGILYVGAESGDDEVLGFIKKGETWQSTLDALLKIKQAGIQSSVMILNGMGGVAYSEQHARNSALLMNEAQPDFLSTLIVSYPLGDQRVVEGFNGNYQLPDQHDLFVELRELISHLELTNTVFRSDHASNYLPLKGTLGADKSAMLAQLDMAINNPERIRLRQEWQRGL